MALAMRGGGARSMAGVTGHLGPWAVMQRALGCGVSVLQGCRCSFALFFGQPYIAEQETSFLVIVNQHSYKRFNRISAPIMI